MPPARAVLTNTPPLQPYRGAGRPEATYLIEQLLDRAAHLIGIDPIEIRRRNFVPPSAMPHKLHSGIAFDSGEFMRVMDECLKLADWNGFSKRAAESKKNGKLRGRGIGYFIEEAAIFNDRMTIRFDPSGTLMILAGTHSHGQGHQTVYAQMVHEWLGVPLESISFIQGDTNEVAVGRGTYGSRSMHVGGNALKSAADAIIEKAKPMAAMMLEAAASDLEFKDGSFHIVGTDRALPLTAVAQVAAPADVPAAAIRSRPRGVGHVRRGAVELSQWLPSLRGRDRSGNRRGHAGALRRGRRRRQGHQQTALRWPDPWRRRARRRPGADGIDRVRRRWPAGRPAASRTTPCRALRISQTCRRNSTEVPATTNPLGIKGAGEAGATGAPPAVISAILDALSPLGIEHIDMPATPNKIWHAIHGARAGKLAAE